MRRFYLVGGLLLAVGAVGCAGSAVVNKRTQSSMSAIRAAQAVGVSEAPRAALHLEMAKAAVKRARALSSQGDKEEAASLLLRAEADAELAVVLSRKETEKVKAAAAFERVRKLRQENL